MAAINIHYVAKIYMVRHLHRRPSHSTMQIFQFVVWVFDQHLSSLRSLINVVMYKMRRLIDHVDQIFCLLE